LEKETRFLSDLKKRDGRGAAGHAVAIASKHLARGGEKYLTNKIHPFFPLSPNPIDK
jgi:hypothetical protein